MKIAVRTLVAVLVLTGAAASTQISSASTTSNKVTFSKTSAMPTPMCPPDDPAACHIGDTQ
jgi:hypothetical protein